MANNNNISPDRDSISSPNTPGPADENHNPQADLESRVSSNLPPLSYGALHRLALILIDIARNPAKPQEEPTTDS